jgi:predicted branched-subunit amino acid permease
MTRNKIFSTIAQVLLIVVGMVPIALCFGFLAEDPQRYVHNLFVVGIYGLLFGLVSLVLSLVD